MRWLVCALVLLVSGCISIPERDPAAMTALDKCRQAPVHDHVLYLAPGNQLVTNVPSVGSSPGNAFTNAFLTDELNGWLSEPVTEGLWIVGNVTLDFWARSTGAPAPVISPSGATMGQGYRFFNQFGSDLSLQPSYATEYGAPYQPQGTVTHFEERLAMPIGGFVVERGSRVRLLLTDLALGGRDGAGHDILFGGETPSKVQFTARCYPAFAWSGATLADKPILLPGNQGSFSHAVPAQAGVNRERIDVMIPAQTQRLTVSLAQVNDASPAKDDVDMTLLDGNGQPLWGIGSPYADETGILWEDNLLQFAGHVIVQVDSYSGAGYQGQLKVVAETARLA